jgi:hypothetical protein
MDKRHVFSLLVVFGASIAILASLGVVYKDQLDSNYLAHQSLMPLGDGNSMEGLAGKLTSEFSIEVMTPEGERVLEMRSLVRTDGEFNIYRARIRGSGKIVIVKLPMDFTTGNGKKLFLERDTVVVRDLPK